MNLSARYEIAELHGPDFDILPPPMHVPSKSAAGGLSPPRALFEIRTGQSIYVLPVSALLPEDEGHSPITVPTVKWQSWFNKSYRIEPDDLIGISGLHVFLHDSILSFNQYDLSRDVYSPDCSRPDDRRSTLRPRTNNRGSDARCPAPSECMTQPQSYLRCHTAPLYLPPHIGRKSRLRYDKFYLVEEGGEVKVRPLCHAVYK